MPALSLFLFSLYCFLCLQHSPPRYPHSSSIASFHSSNQSLWSADLRPVPVLGSGITASNKTDQSLHSRSCHSSGLCSHVTFSVKVSSLTAILFILLPCYILLITHFHLVILYIFILLPPAQPSEKTFIKCWLINAMDY